MGGKLTFPGGGFYHATKYAVEAISDALRFEVAASASTWSDRARPDPHRVRRRGGGLHRRRRHRQMTAQHGKFNHHVGKATAGVYEGPMAKLGGGPDAVAKVIDKALSSNRPRPRYTVTPSARLSIAQRKLGNGPRLGPPDANSVSDAWNLVWTKVPRPQWC